VKNRKIIKPVITFQMLLVFVFTVLEFKYIIVIFMDKNNFEIVETLLYSGEEVTIEVILGDETI
jgi:hypothetical protein